MSNEQRRADERAYWEEHGIDEEPGEEVTVEVSTPLRHRRANGGATVTLSGVQRDILPPDLRALADLHRLNEGCTCGRPHCEQVCDDWPCATVTALAHLADLAAALAWYAAPESWQYDVRRNNLPDGFEIITAPPPAHDDNGERARRALAALRGEG